MNHNRFHPDKIIARFLLSLALATAAANTLLAESPKPADSTLSASANPATNPLVPARIEGFINARDGQLFLKDRAYRAIGVNVPHLHQAYLGTWFHIEQIYGTPQKARHAMIEAIEDASQSGFAFIRFFAHPGYPIDIEKLYAKNRAEYWRQMDALFALCRRHGLRLVPVLGVTEWNSSSGEPKQSILDPQSKTSQATSLYLREFVTRYKDDPAVLMWELQNELMLFADVDMQGVKLLPKGVYPPGATVRETGRREDSLTWAMIQQIYRQQTAFIKKLDSNHLVNSGDAQSRPEATSRRETFPDFKFRDDTWREFVANNLAAQPEPLDIFSLHHYGTFDASGEWPKSSGLASVDRFRLLARAVHTTRTPLFIGELGQEQPSFQEDSAAKWTQAYLEMAEQERISLIALWVWHFPWQPDRTLSSQTHPLLVQRVAAFNRRYARQDEDTGH